MEYTHQVFGVDPEVKTISGHYTIDKEKVLKYKDKKILCVIGMGVIDSSCCGVGGCRYALVPGYIKQWKKTDESGCLISEVEPIVNEQTKQAISNIIKEEEIVTQINFW